MLILAHRGASFEAPENTLPAFSRALDAGVDGIEFDIYPLQDEWIVFHDRYLTRLAAHPGRLCDLTLAQVRRLKVFGQHPVPTLAEALEFINGRCLVNIELKGADIRRGLTRHLLNAVNNANFKPEQLIISSFNHHWLKQLKQDHPEQLIGALTSACPLTYAQFAEELNAWSVHADVDFVTKEFVEDAHQRNLKVFVYTVDEPEDIYEMKTMGVDGIFTNDPRRSINILNGLPVTPPELQKNI
ncbi:glycerophosphodiester phosphodiesterase [Pseudidiomarina salinarum]|uniref:Glycerophosphodiester phosphodiesterase n=1 Tax=Pseudidiomarina salinarum TaxID=435908 RepID=A0A094IS66_9GAMM|nr:glycerophosphodiester phosphodiesterase [Pseudidiomarina salinarum]KFZ30530.1 glycerophosphodiester phosphodiesterase [Pseudidiomarina salinarum]RUO69040.1 glycerophosphodiester phosphodiesterase [Pseudidiomarina salinarum]